MVINKNLKALLMSLEKVFDEYDYLIRSKYTETPPLMKKQIVQDFYNLAEKYFRKHPVKNK